MSKPKEAADRSSGRLAVGACGAFLTVQGLLALFGWRLVIPTAYYQLLPEAALGSQPWSSLWHLHSQPPMLNAAWAVALTFERSLGLSAATLLYGLNLLLACCGLVAFCLLLDAGGVRRRLRLVAVALLVLYAPLHYFAMAHFYPIWEWSLSLCIVLAGQRYLVSPTRLRLGVVSGLLVVLSNTRSLFHPLFCLGLLVSLVWAGGKRKSVGWIVLGATVLLLAWPAKNWVLFGSFSSSSWQGLNLASGLEIDRSPFAAAFSYGDGPVAERERMLAVTRVPERYESAAALSQIEKASGVPNWNHFAMLEYSRTLGRRALRAVVDEPLLQVRKSVANFLSLTYAPLRNPTTGGLAERGQGSRSTQVFQAIYELPLFRPLAWTERGPLTLFTGIFPLLLLLVVLRVRKSGEVPERAALGIGLALVAWLTVLVVLVDGVEGNRMRVAVDGVLLLMAAVVLEGTLRSARAQ